MFRNTFTPRSLFTCALVAGLVVLATGIASADDGAEIILVDAPLVETADTAISVATSALEVTMEKMESTYGDPNSPDVAQFAVKDAVGVEAAAPENVVTDSDASSASTLSTVCNSGYGRIDPTSETEKWSFYVSAGQRITLRVTRTSGNLDGWLKLVDPWGQEMAYDDDSGGSMNPMLTYFAVYPGRFEAWVSSYAWASSGDYRLEVCIESAASSGGGRYCAPKAYNRTCQCVDYVKNTYNMCRMGIDYAYQAAQGGLAQVGYSQRTWNWQTGDVVVLGRYVSGVTGYAGHIAVLASPTMTSGKDRYGRETVCVTLRHANYNQNASRWQTESNCGNVTTDLVCMSRTDFNSKLTVWYRP